jgi:hypothetical protein
MNEPVASRSKWPAYGAAIRAFLFAAMSFYWALGGTIGLETLGTGFENLNSAEGQELITFTWVTGVLKVITGLLALALVQLWGRLIPRRLLLPGAWVAGILLTLYGMASFVQHGLMVFGTIEIARFVGSRTAAIWHWLFWDPFWIVGGVLFVLAARRFSRQ